MMIMNFELMLSICLGVGLAASSGFRVFVPLFVMSIAAYFNVFSLSENWTWLGSPYALIIFAVASIVESLAYLVPIVDNALDSLAIPLAGMAGTMTVASNVANLSPEATWVLAIVAGGGAATAVKSTSALTRVASTATTAGLANPVIGAAETGAAVGLSVLAIVMPVAAAIVAILGLLCLIWFGVKIKKRLANEP